MRGVDEGAPIAYVVLARDVPVYASGGESVGTVDHVVAAPELDIFHGIVMVASEGRRFVEADLIAELHERGVDLRIDVFTVADLPEPEGASVAWRDSEPGVKPTPWQHLVDRVALRDPKRENWTKED